MADTLSQMLKLNRASAENRFNALVAAARFTDTDFTEDDDAETLFGGAMDFISDGMNAIEEIDDPEERAEVRGRLANAVYGLAVGYKLYDLMKSGDEANASLDWVVTAEIFDDDGNYADEVDFAGFVDGKPIVSSDDVQVFKSYEMASYALRECRKNYPDYEWRIDCDAVSTMNVALCQKSLRKYIEASKKSKEEQA